MAIRFAEDYLGLLSQYQTVSIYRQSITVIQTRNQGEFMFYPIRHIPGESTGCLYLFLHQRPGQDWRPIQADSDSHCSLEPFFDFDGDGVPELRGGIRYKDSGIMQFFPERKIISFSHIR